jgi:hypothetical protein
MVGGWTDMNLNPKTLFLVVLVSACVALLAGTAMVVSEDVQMAYFAS